MQKIVVLGAAESGVGAALLAKAKGYEVFVSDAGLITKKYKNDLQEYQVPFEEGGHSVDKLVDASLCIKSPGIPDDVKVVLEIQKQQIPVIAEIEFAARFSKAKMIAITGTNGKTTTTLLTYHLLKAAGLKVGLAGNVGFSLARQVIDDQYDYYVIETSSFQLDGMYEFKADIGILLNITTDHLDRYDHSLSKYIGSKFRILQNMQANDAFIYFADDPNIKKKLNSIEVTPKRLPISLIDQVTQGAYFTKEELIFKQADAIVSLPVHMLPLPGKHNYVNTMAAVLVARTIGLTPDHIQNHLQTFVNAPHRMEKVDDLQGVTFYNDSKATNIDSVYFALESFNQPVIWIAGGIDKGNDYQQIIPLVKQKVKGLVCLGVDNTKLMSAFQGKIPQIAESNNAFNAVQKAFDMAENSSVVLLSPACASFDLFKNYEDRGDQFKNAVKRLIAENSN